MWLVPRDTRGQNRRTDVPGVVREALVRWYGGEGDQHDHRASVILVVKARDARQWVACDCRGDTDPPPLLSPAFLSESDTYYLRRLTSERQERPEHDPDCPFFREQAPPRFREKATATPRVIDEPSGLFSAHRFAPEKLAMRPDDRDPDDRARGAPTPRLARLLWLLMEMAQVNVVTSLEPDRRREQSMASEFARLRRAAERIDIAPGIPLARHLYTHIDPFDRKMVFARLRKAEKKWPPDHAPHAFLLLYATDISGSTITLAEDRHLETRTRVQHFAIHGRRIAPPYLVLAVVGEHSKREGYVALRAFAQPIVRTTHFIPVHYVAERAAISGLIDLQYRFRRRGIDLALKRPLFDIHTRADTVRPTTALDLLDHRTGEMIEAALQVIPDADSKTIDTLFRDTEKLRLLGPVVTVDAQGMARSGLEHLILEQLGIA